MSKPVRLFFFVLLLVCCTTQGFAQLQINPPAFTLTGIKTSLQIKGLNEANTEPVNYRVDINGQSVLSGVSLESKLQEINVVFTSYGNAKINLTVGNQTAASTLRCIPGWLSIRRCLQLFLHC